MSLFNKGDFSLHAGTKSNFFIDCDNLTEEDWDALASIAVINLPQFKEVKGIPRGGIPFANALEKYATGDSMDPVLIVDDVLTTGVSMTEVYTGVEIGVVAFARGICPFWVTPLFKMIDSLDGLEGIPIC